MINMNNTYSLIFNGRMVFNARTKCRIFNICKGFIDFIDRRFTKIKEDAMIVICLGGKG